jgi:hypothetical protein
MNCQRCNGLAVRDDSLAVQMGSPLNFHGWRCVNCGMIVDEVINRNRRVILQRRVPNLHDRRRYSRQAA